MKGLTVETESQGSYADASEATIEMVISCLDRGNTYVILQREDRPEAFVQAALARTPDASFRPGYVVEHRDAGGVLWQVDAPDLTLVERLLVGWAFDRPGWSDGLDWSRLGF